MTTEPIGFHTGERAGPASTSSITLEDLLAEIEADLWFVKIIQVNGSRHPDATHPLGHPPGRVWWADLYLPSYLSGLPLEQRPLSLRKHGYGPTMLAALLAAWESPSLGPPVFDYHHKLGPETTGAAASVLARFTNPAPTAPVRRV